MSDPVGTAADTVSVEVFSDVVARGA